MKQDLLNRIAEEGVAVDRQLINVNTIIILLIVAGMLFGFFFVVKKYVSPLLDNRKIRDKALRLVFRAEVISWGIFTLFALVRLLSDQIWIGTLVILAVGIVGWHFWKDFLPGLWIRFSFHFQPGDPIRFEEVLGKIEGMGITALKVRSDEDELIFLPYGKVQKGILVKRQVKGKLITGKITLNVGQANEAELVKKMEVYLLSCPWIIKPSANAIHVQPGGLLSISFNAVDQRSLGKAERFLKEKYRAYLNQSAKKS